MEFRLGSLAPMLAKSVTYLDQEQVVPRIWSRDHTVWAETNEEIVDRLGWLDVHHRLTGIALELEVWARSLVGEGFRQAVLIGMGGSSLAPEVFGELCGRPNRGLELLILDTTDPEQIGLLESQLDLSTTLFVVATKSGGTIETLSGYQYFRAKLAAHDSDQNAGAHFVAITDPGSSLVELAHREGFRRTFENDPNIGGRYSALSLFGLVPLALAGGNVSRLLASTETFAEEAKQSASGNDAARFGMLMGRLALAKKDKLTILFPQVLAPLGDWIEQLIAESLGKSGRGVVPILGEGVEDVDTFGDDRFCIVIAPVTVEDAIDQDMGALADRCEQAGHPVVMIPFGGAEDLGGHFFIWEFATAVAGHALGVHPFDQPDVEAAKVASRAYVATFEESGFLPASETVAVSNQALRKFLEQGVAGEYLAIQAYLPALPQYREVLDALRQRIAHHFGLAVTVGYGPRFLHSTGQLHKGGAANGLNLQLVRPVDPCVDVTIPGSSAGEERMTFGTLQRAQALGDAEALRTAGRRVLTMDLGTDPISKLEILLSCSR